MSIDLLVLGGVDLVGEGTMRELVCFAIQRGR